VVALKSLTNYLITFLAIAVGIEVIRQVLFKKSDFLKSFRFVSSLQCCCLAYTVLMFIDAGILATSVVSSLMVPLLLVCLFLPMVFYLMDT